MAVAAAFGWATYYVFVLWGTPGTAPSAILVYPFAFGGAGFVVLSLLAGHGRALAAEWSHPEAYLRCGLMLGMQLSVLACTYLAGPVDTSLLSLIGDVVVTPILAAALFAVPRDALRRVPVIAGLVLSLGGGTLTIVGGHRIAGVHGLGWVAVLACPFVVAIYFPLAARASESAPMPAVVGQSMLGAALGALLLTPALPGGTHGLLAIGPTGLALVAANGFVSFFVAPVLYFLAIRREGIVLPPLLMTAIPIFTLLLSTEVLHESVPWLGLVGIPIAVGGAVLAMRATAADPPPEGRWSRPAR